MLKLIDESRSQTKKSSRKTSHFTILKRWLEGPNHLNIPEELLSYRSPVNERVLISLFMGVGKVNHFLNKTMNNFWLYSVRREELLHFVKEVFKNTKLRSSQLHFQKYDPTESNLHKLKKKFPYLKTSDCMLLLEKLLEHGDRATLETLGLKKYKVRKLRLGRRRKKVTSLKQIKKEVTSHSLQQMIEKNFILKQL